MQVYRGENLVSMDEKWRSSVEERHNHFHYYFTSTYSKAELITLNDRNHLIEL